jgi:putative phosphoesterase
MELGMVADTHDNLDIVRRAVDAFEAAGVDIVVHCGDFVAPFSAAPFDGPWEFYAVRGNNDGEWALAETVSDFGTYWGEMGTLSVAGQEIAVYHGTAGEVVESLVDCGHYEYVLHGHTHEQAHERREGTVRINPGGLAFAGAPEPCTVAMLTPRTGDLRFETVGEGWAEP